MKRSRYSESQIISILKEAESGIPVAELCRKHGMSDVTFYNWRSKYGGMDVFMLKRVKELEEENRRLKKMYAEERLKAEIVQEALEKSGEAIPAQGDGQMRRCRTADLETSGMPGIPHQRNLLPLRTETVGRERLYRRLLASPDYK